MALYAEVEKLEESDQLVRYRFTDIKGVERTMTLNKVTEDMSVEDGVEDMLYRAVARKVAIAWTREGSAPDRLLVQS